jgi:hypothetical protein
VRARNADDRFGTTANMTTRPAGGRQKALVLAGAAILLVGSAAGAIVTARVRRVQLEDRAREATTASAAAPLVAAATPPAPAPPTAPPPAAQPLQADETRPAPSRALPPAHEGRGKRHAGAGHSPGAAAPSAPAAAPSDAAPAAKPPAAEPAAAPAPARGVREVLAEAEKLLGQGEVADACARGEEAKRLASKSPPVHKFLGKCYMRAGRTREANDNYTQYLELAPNAPDAPFVKSMIK